MRIRLFLAPFFLIPVLTLSQSLPADRVLRVEELYNYLQPEVREEMRGAGVTGLASYFRNQFSEHFFYDYRSLPARLLHYNKTYDNRAAHQARALDHMTKFSDSTQWVLPFDYLDGEPVNAYALRHLARQHKMVDVAFYYFNDSRRSELIQ